MLPNGDVGIGLSNPTAKLEVNGGIKISDAPQGNTLKLTRNGFGVLFGNSSVADDLQLYNLDGTTVYQRWHGSGNVSIGNLIDTGEKFQVNGTGKFAGEVTIPNGTVNSSAVNKSQLDLKANLNGGNTFNGDQNFNHNISASNIIVGSNDPESGYKFQVEGAFAMGAKGKARLYGGTLDPTTTFIQSRDLNISQNLAIYAKNILIGSPKDSGEKFQLTGNADINGFIMSRNLANDSSIKLQSEFTLPNIQGTNYIGTDVKPIIMQRHGGNVGIGITSLPTATLEVGGTGKFLGEVQVAPATSSNSAVTLEQLNAATIGKIIEVTLSLNFLAISPGQARGLVLTVDGVSSGDFILATTSDPLGGDQIIYARSSATNTVFVGILNASSIEQPPGNREIKLRILK